MPKIMTTAAAAAVSPVFGAATRLSTSSFTILIGERLAVSNVTEPFATFVGIMVSHALPVDRKSVV